MARCSTTHGMYRCDREVGPDGMHDGECETDRRPRAPLTVVPEPGQDLDSGRELLNAFRRVEVLSKALEEIRSAPCEAEGNASCLCCLHDRMIATAALKGDA